MDIWNTYWCFYNSLAFSNITAVALLGMIILVLPAIFTLPPNLTPKLGEFHTDYIRLRVARSDVRFIGCWSVISSLLVVYCYIRILFHTKSSTCDMSLVPTLRMWNYLTAIYFLSGIGLILLGTFYFYLQRTRKLYDGLKSVQEKT